MATLGHAWVQAGVCKHGRNTEDLAELETIMLQKSNLATLLLAAVAVAPTAAVVTQFSTTVTTTTTTTTKNPDCADNKGMCCESKKHNCHHAANGFKSECSTVNECVNCHGITQVANGNLVGLDTLDCSDQVVAVAGAGAGAVANPPPAPAALPPKILKATQAASTESSSGLTDWETALIVGAGAVVVVGGVAYNKWDQISRHTRRHLPVNDYSSYSYSYSIDDTGQLNLL